jgi:uncharacterized membrane protein YphA (DoxX/SURF4 family)
MKILKKIIFICAPIFSFFFLIPIASAHEAYVIPYNTFWAGMNTPLSLHAFDALKDPANIRVTIIIVLSVWLLLGLNFIFRLSSVGKRCHAFFEKFSSSGPVLMRMTIATAFLFSSLAGSFLGPELHGSLMPHHSIVQIALFVMSMMIFFGIFTELAALVGIVLFSTSFFVFGPYVFTYLNYLGELIVLLLFGARILSVDKYFFGNLKRFESFRKYESVIIRVFYGLALVYAAITVKLLHPDLTVSVVNTWNLTQFHLLFPHDPLLVTFGAGIVECVIGLFIIFGFEMRLTILISLFYITLSLLYFREMVWPHLLLYGISFYLLVQPEVFTLDHIFFKEHRNFRNWWKRPFLVDEK